MGILGMGLVCIGNGALEGAASAILDNRGIQEAILHGVLYGVSTMIVFFVFTTAFVVIRGKWGPEDWLIPLRLFGFDDRSKSAEESSGEESGPIFHRQYSDTDVCFSGKLPDFLGSNKKLKHQGFEDI